MWEQYWEDRGSPWEYDPGPAKNRSWSRLFAETPNYRGFGIAMSGNEEFRWHFGPMFYRGRLGDQQVKVLIVGQEGAQDESLSHRSFTGGTGGRMQHLLNHSGSIARTCSSTRSCTRSSGSTTGCCRSSPSTRRRRSPSTARSCSTTSSLRNDLQLVVAVGRAAKESLASWVESHGGTADPDNLHLADASVISPGLHMVGVLHPGGAGKGGAVTAIIASFNAAINHVHQWVAADPSWLPVDPGAVRVDHAVHVLLGPDPVPRLPVRRRLAARAAARRRRIAATARRRSRSSPTTASTTTTGTTLTYPGGSGRHRRRLQRRHRRRRLGAAAARPQGLRSRPGRRRSPRCCRAASRVSRGPTSTSFGLKCSPSFGTGPIFRGRLDRPSILVLADQQSHDDLFTMRALTGDDGQHLQSFLQSSRDHQAVRDPARAARSTRSPTTRRPSPRRSTAPAVRALYAEAVRLSRPQVLLFVGPLAATSAHPRHAGRDAGRHDEVAAADAASTPAGKQR